MKPENAPIIGWARPIAVARAPYCAVVELGQSVVTSCRGRWSAIEPTHYLEGRDRDQDDDGNTLKKCEACDDNARIEQSLGRLPTGQSTAPDWDLSDLGGES